MGVIDVRISRTQLDRACGNAQAVGFGLLDSLRRAAGSLRRTRRRGRSGPQPGNLTRELSRSRTQYGRRSKMNIGSVDPVVRLPSFGNYADLSTLRAVLLFRRSLEP
jgi:hypothetical protein